MADHHIHSIRIVPPEELMLQEHIRTEEFDLTTLVQALGDVEHTVIWCARRRLLANSIVCPHCQVMCELRQRTVAAEHRVWQRGCGARTSLRFGSLFHNSHLTLVQSLMLMYGWCRDWPQCKIMAEMRANKNTIMDWCETFREICETDLEENPQTIGGLDEETLAPIVVEIDESKYFHRKYHRGQWRDGHWVFGGIERDSGKCFLVEVADRREDTLRRETLRWIQPGSHILSDGWPAYRNISEWAGGIFTHDVVVHQRHFVDPINRSIHTQNVENMWMRAKRKLRRQFGTSEAKFPSYLHEFMWRNRFGNHNLFQELIIATWTSYRLQ